MGIKVGNITVYFNGRFICPVMWQKLLRSVILVSIPGILLLVPTGFVLAPVKPLAILNYVIICIFLVISILALAICAVVDPGIIPGRELQEYYLNQLYEIITKKQRTLYQGRQTGSAYGSPDSQKQLTIQEKLQLRLNLAKSMESEKQISPAQDVEKFINKDPRSLFKNSRAYQILDSIHHVDRQLIFFEKGFKYSPKFCPTCRFYRPIRSSHSSKSNVCIQRYDHFCEWIGTDVGLHNHGIFYIMLLVLMIYSLITILFGFICLIVSIVVPARCGVQGNAFKILASSGLCSRVSMRANGLVDLSVALNFVDLVLSLAVMVAGSYIFYSLFDLAQFHYVLLKSGALTKEDLGGGTMSVTAPYSLGTVRKNLKLAFDGLKQPRILHIFIDRQEKLLTLAKSSQFVNSFDALGRVLRLNGISGFENIDEAADPDEDALQRSIRAGTGVKKSFRESLMNIDEQQEQIPQRIAENITTDKIMTARDAFEFAIKQAREMVKITAADFTKLRDEKPELFEAKTESHELQLTNMCKKKEKKQVNDIGDIDVQKGKSYKNDKSKETLPPIPVTSNLTGITNIQPEFI